MMDHLDLVRKSNAKRLAKGQERKQIRIRSGLKCWCCGVLVDEEILFMEKIDKLKRVIRKEVSR